MPASVTSLLAVFDVFNLSIEMLGLPMRCLELDSFHSELLFLVLLPCVLGLLILSCSMATEVIAKRKTASFKAGLIRALPYLLYLSFFAFPLVSSRAFQAFDCEEFDDGSRFLRADYSLNCEGPEHDKVTSLAWVAIAVCPIGIPLLYLMLLLAARKAILTEQPTGLSRSLNFLHQDYEVPMFWWEVVEIYKKARRPLLSMRAHSHLCLAASHVVRARSQLFLVGFVVLIRPGSTFQLIIGFVFSFVITLFSTIAGPFRRRADNQFSVLCNFSLIMVLFFTLVLKMGVLSEEVKGVLSDEMRGLYTYDQAQLSVALLLTLLASLLVALVLVVYQVYRSTRTVARAVAARRKAFIARGRLSYPPSYDWVPTDGNKFAMFLSHYKVEAGSDARYLSDLVKRMTGCAAYLDSNDLADFRTLFNEGEHTLTYVHHDTHARTQHAGHDFSTYYLW